MTTIYYVGDLRGGLLAMPERTVRFEAGVPLEVTDDEAAVVAGPEWSTTDPAPKVKKSRRADPVPDEKADPPAEPITASADTKEP